MKCCRRNSHCRSCCLSLSVERQMRNFMQLPFEALDRMAMQQRLDELGSEQPTDVRRLNRTDSKCLEAGASRTEATQRLLASISVGDLTGSRRAIGVMMATCRADPGTRLLRR
jgi:hypothetical protein